MWSEKLTNVRLSKYVKRNGNKLAWIIILLWFYCTLFSQSLIIEGKDFEQPKINLKNCDGDGSSSSSASSSSSSSTSKSTSSSCISSSNIPHSRRKRFLAFPLGSSFSCAICMTTGVVGNPNVNYLSMGLNWGIAYDLPNATWILEHTHHGTFKGNPSGSDNDTTVVGDMGSDKPDEKDIKAADAEAEKNIQMVQLPMIKRRERRHIYGKLETIIDSMGYNGRDCILRALCESQQYFRKNKLSMIGEMMRTVFSLPKQRIFTRELHENSEIEIYDRAFRRARDVSCSEQYDCAFSLLELAFGKYSEPPPGYY